MRIVRFHFGTAVALLGAGAFGASTGHAALPTSARFVTVSAPFPVSLPSSPRLAQPADPFAAPPVLATVSPTATMVSFDPSAAPPGTGDGLYVDWVTPLQAPLGPSPDDEATLGDAFAGAGPGQAFSAAEQDRAPLSVPEANTLGLLGTALLPLVGLLLRRRH